MSRLLSLALLGTCALAFACSSSSDGDAASDSGLPDSGLPDTFSDCPDAVCPVQLGAFTANPGAIPYCPPKQADLELDCTEHPGLETGTCGELYVARYVYGFPGDYYQCVYSSGALVGAKWAPDNHPTQIAGTQPPETCALAPACSDGGADAATD